jgi:hypothetical protein
MGAHYNGPETLQFAFERMKAKARAVQPFEALRCVERSQNFADAFHHLGRKKPAIIVLVKPLQPFVSKACNHRLSTYLRKM